jgi:ABC-type uncharacterized transport system ATPase subunit
MSTPGPTEKYFFLTKEMSRKINFIFAAGALHILLGKNGMGGL